MTTGKYSATGMPELVREYGNRRAQINEHIDNVTEGTWRWDGQPVKRLSGTAPRTRIRLIGAIKKLDLLYASMVDWEDN
jgi:hypothetical protein